MSTGPFTINDLRSILVGCDAIPSSMIVDNPETSLADLNVDSMSLVALQLEIQDRYGVNLQPEDAYEARTVGAIVDRINARRAGAR